jgi:hypothetical protein
MKNINRNFRNLEYVTAGRKRYNYHFSFAKKDALIRNIEIIVACIIALIAGIGVYNIL